MEYISFLKKYSQFFILALMTLVIQSCQQDITELDKYQPGDWLKGKIFTQIKAEEDLNVFISCLELTGYDTILDKSGSYTVFAPTDSAFNLFFQSHPEYNTVNDIPIDELLALVEFQIIFDAWSMKQLQSLDIQGWVDPNNSLHAPRAYKRKTIYLQQNKEYPAHLTGNMYKVAGSQQASTNVVAYTRSNKYAPIFFNELFNIYDLDYRDYEFYFGRTYDPGNLYYANAGFNTEIPAENGFVYKTDHVATPLPNAEEIMEEDNEDNYNLFLNLIYEFSEFNMNAEATFNQPGAAEGLDIDTLYNLDFPDLIFNIHNELTGNTNNFKNTYREHGGLMAPNDDVFNGFIDEFISPGWGSLTNMPNEIKKLIINSHMTNTPIYPSYFNEGFLNGNDDIVQLSEEDVLQRQFGSNSTFLDLNKTIIPRAFQSICRPVFLTRNYQTMLYAIDRSKTLTALKRKNANYALYLPSDFGTGLTGDSSLVRVIDNPDLNTYHFETYDMSEDKWIRVNNSDLRKRIFNQVAVTTPTGLANKEFIENLAGNYIVVNNAEGTVSGTQPTTFGYNGDSTLVLTPRPYPEYTDNGQVYEVDAFFSFLTGANFYGVFISKYNYFFELLKKAELYDIIYYRFPFLTDGERYTVFVPSQQALQEYGADDLSKEELRDLLQYHFVKENLIFTDGTGQDGQYETTRKDESSTTFVTRYSRLTIHLRPDIIEIFDKDGNLYLEIQENGSSTNQMVTYDPNPASSSRWDFITTGVIHEIDKVLDKNLLQPE